MKLMERTCVIVAFGDIAGFSAWMRRGSNAPEIISDFVGKFYDELQAFVLNNRSVQIKYLGDGFMVLKELTPECTGGVCISKFIKDIAKLGRRLRTLVRHCEFPPPDGFRIRIAHGYVSKLHVFDPADPERKEKIWEFIGYAVNLAQKLLDVTPNSLLLIHEGVVKALNRKSIGFKLRKFNKEKEKRMSGVDPEDIEGLWVGEL